MQRLFQRNKSGVKTTAAVPPRSALRVKTPSHKLAAHQMDPKCTVTPCWYVTVCLEAVFCQQQITSDYAGLCHTALRLSLK